MGKWSRNAKSIVVIKKNNNKIQPPKQEVADVHVELMFGDIV